ncbi:MAG: GWxTD domain-containing protein [Thermoanaerobaculia bacterium]
MRRATLLVLAAALSAGELFAATPGELFSKAKEQFRLAAYPAALETLRQLDEETSKPQYGQERAALLPALHFYRGASYAALGRGPEARDQFEVFLTYQPNASLDPAMYPKKVIAALEEARKSLEKKGRTERIAGTSPATSLAKSYAAFRLAMDPGKPYADEGWADGPVRFLLTPEERRDFQALGGAASRSEFVTAFWKARDPKPETADNEFREEFEKRVAFADSRFTQQETRGAMTDRGMVFILLGPPTYIGRKPLTTGDDAADPNVLKRYRASDVRAAAQPGGTRAAQVARVDAVTGPGSRVNEAASNWQEVWHYWREHLPKDVPYLQVDFQFVTKKGYGQNVLQREAQILDTLERAKAKLREAKA